MLDANPLTAARAEGKLRPKDQIELEALEATIRAGWTTFMEVGNALATIREKRFFKPKYGSIEEYALREFGYSRAYAYSLMDSAEVSAQLSAIADIEVRPVNEAQCRELIRVPKDKRAAAWTKVVEGAGSNPITARIIRDAVAEFKPIKNSRPKNHKEPTPPTPKSSAGLELLDEIEELTGKGNSGPLKEKIAALRNWIKQQG